MVDTGLYTSDDLKSTSETIFYSMNMNILNTATKRKIFAYVMKTHLINSSIVLKCIKTCVKTSVKMP